MRQFRIVGDTFQFVSDNLFDLRLNAVVVFLYLLLHAVVAVRIGEVRDDGDFLVGGFLPLHLVGIHHNLRMENLLLDALREIVRYRTDEHTLCQAGNLARRDKAVHLRVDGGGLVLPVDGDALPFLQHLAETFGKVLGGFAHHLPGENVADGIHHDLRLLVPVVAHQLAEILKAQTNGNLVGTCRCDEVVQPFEIDGGQLVDDNGGFELPFLVDELYDAGIVQSQSRTVNILAVRIVAHTEYFRLFRVVDVQRELTVGHYPIKLW